MDHKSVEHTQVFFFCNFELSVSLVVLTIYYCTQCLISNFTGGVTTVVRNNQDKEQEELQISDVKVMKVKAMTMTRASPIL